MKLLLTRKAQRRYTAAIAQATLDWWDFDGSYREANDYDDADLDVIEIEQTAAYQKRCDRWKQLNEARS